MTTTTCCSPRQHATRLARKPTAPLPLNALCNLCRWPHDRDPMLALGLADEPRIRPFDQLAGEIAAIRISQEGPPHLFLHWAKPAQGNISDLNLRFFEIRWAHF